MIGRQELILGAAVVLAIVLLVWMLALLRRAKDQLAVVGAGLVIIGAMLFFVVPAILAPMTLGVGLVVLAIRVPPSVARDDEERIACPFCAEDIKRAAIVCPFCRSDLRAGERRMRP